MKNDTTFLTKEEAKSNLKWYLFDANGKVLGRLASEIAKVLRGRHKVSFTPHVDAGDGVIILNAEKVKVTGYKEARKTYRHYTGYVGGLKETPYRVMQEKKPEHILLHAIKGMMPKNKLSKSQLKKLRIFKGEEHGMEAQQPIKLNI